MIIQVPKGDIILVGHVSKDVVIRETKDYKKIANFSIATGRDSSKSFYKCVVWGGSTEYDEAITIKKGDKIRVEGILSVKEWQGKKYNEIAVEWLDVKPKSKAIQQAVTTVTEQIEQDEYDLPF